MTHGLYGLTESVRDGTLILDIETTTDKTGGFRGVDGRRPYLIGVANSRTDAAVILRSFAGPPPALVSEFSILVGHNVKFDLEHLRRFKTDVLAVAPHDSDEEVPIYEWIFKRRKAVVWDTQFVTYLWSGHSETFPTLERSCELFGVASPKKAFDLATELPKVDYDISKIPNLAEYLGQDVNLTNSLFNAQMRDPWVVANFKWILKMLAGYMGTFEVEYNGLHVDTARLTSLKPELEKLIADTENNVRAAALATGLVPDAETMQAWSLSSPTDVATVLFGGNLEWDEKVPDGYFKSGAKAGMPRTRKVSKSVTVPGCGIPATEFTDTGKPSVSEQVLEGLSAHVPMVRELLKYRSYSKILGTYVEGMGKHLRPHDGGYYVHPTINTCATATGRTSSSKPNLQNLPTNDETKVASIFTSRFGEHGVVLEVDFKQIEVVALAILSNDAQLGDDIRAGRDIHTEVGKTVFAGKMTKEQRRIVKTVVFGMIYGGGSATLAAQSGVDERIVKKIINAFYKRYPDVKLYFDTYYAVLNWTMGVKGIPTKAVLGSGFVEKALTIDSLTGRRYTYKTYLDKRTGEPGVSYTESRNYPIQGLATGDVVLTALGEVYQKILPALDDDVKLVGLVHDSLRFDLKVDKLPELVRQLKYVLENAGKALEDASGIKWNLPIRVTFSSGTDFGHMEEWDEERLARVLASGADM